MQLLYDPRDDPYHERLGSKIPTGWMISNPYRLPRPTQTNRGSCSAVPDRSPTTANSCRPYRCYATERCCGVRPFRSGRRSAPASSWPTSPGVARANGGSSKPGREVVPGRPTNTSSRRWRPDCVANHPRSRGIVSADRFDAAAGSVWGRAVRERCTALNPGPRSLGNGGACPSRWRVGWSCRTRTPAIHRITQRASENGSVSVWRFPQIPPIDPRPESHQSGCGVSINASSSS